MNSLPRSWWTAVCSSRTAPDCLRFMRVSVCLLITVEAFATDSGLWICSCFRIALAVLRGASHEHVVLRLQVGTILQRQAMCGLFTRKH